MTDKDKDLMIATAQGWVGYLEKQTRDRAEGYEDALEEAVAACKPELDRLRHEIRAALAQKVRYTDIDRAMHIATASGLIDCCSRCHEWLTGKRQKYSEARYALGMVDALLGCELINEGRIPAMEEAQVAFARLFDAICTAVAPDAVRTFRTNHPPSESRSTPLVPRTRHQHPRKIKPQRSSTREITRR